MSNNPYEQLSADEDSFNNCMDLPQLAKGRSANVLGLKRAFDGFGVSSRFECKESAYADQY